MIIKTLAEAAEYFSKRRTPVDVQVDKKIVKAHSYAEAKKLLDKPVSTDISKMKKDDLIELAMSKGIEVNSKATKAVIIEMINNEEE